MSGRLFRMGALACLGMALAACEPSEPEVRPLPAGAQATPAEAAPAAPAMDAAAQLAGVGELHVGAAFGKGPGDDAFASAGMRELMEGDCEYYEGGTLPAGLSMMVIADRIARFDAHDERAPGAEGPPLPFGLWVGMTEVEARERLPAGVVASPHAYASPDGEYLTWTDPQAGLALRLETLDGVVTSIYWGQPEAVELIEGCA
ncbi:conserved exported hypothetical protein [uncultured Stenotrophomonas sp.]|uniref:Lipoprotein n=1 Tax=uncultured Stenotrophomonas sp. TaxID=165438 RepID=A0A1Y5Q2L1_9GAMM|nr:conserved exported hypothetical protein [uncultured Stenotrophomonas sp.]